MTVGENSKNILFSTVHMGCVAFGSISDWDPTQQPHSAFAQHRLTWFCTRRSGTGSAGGWLVLQLQGWWQTKQRLMCPSLHAVLQKMVNIKHRISPMPLLAEFSPRYIEGKHCLPAGPAHEEGTWRPPKVSLPKTPSSWFYTAFCFSDLASAHSFEPRAYTGTPACGIHSVHALAALPFQPLPGGIGKSLRACEWQLAHQHAEMEISLSWVKEKWLYFSCCSSYLLDWIWTESQIQ